MVRENYLQKGNGDAYHVNEKKNNNNKLGRGQINEIGKVQSHTKLRKK